MKNFVLILALFVSTVTWAMEGWEAQLTKLESSLRSRNQDQVFAEFLTKYWDHLMVTYPEWATFVGYPGQNDRLTDNSLKAIREREKETPRVLAFYKQIRREKLSPANQLTYDLLVDRAELSLAWQKFPEELLAIDQMNNVAQSLAQLLESMPRSTTKDYDDRIARLSALPAALNDNIETLKEGMKVGITTPKAILTKVPSMLKEMTPTDVTKSPFYTSFKEIPSLIASQDQTRVQKKAQEVIANTVYPAVKSYAKFVEAEYIPKARATLGLSALPNGKDWYDNAILQSTTVKMTAEQIHQLGLNEVARLESEMNSVLKQVSFKGSLTDFMKQMRTDKKLKFKSAEEMLLAYRAFAKQVDAKLPMLFKTLPRNTYGVEEVPKFMAKASAAAYYEAGALQTGRPGTFFLNTARAKDQNRWETESLTFHEAVPGHHFQISLAQEVDALPDIRKHDGYTAYSEGWGLYAETLGYEMGFYKDPYSRFGQLTNEIWRACRLVVDTGLHAKGWSRKQAIEYMKKYLAKTEEDIAVEVDRYVAWPGQALGYKIGQLKFRELRERATKELGSRFDVRAFHDQVLLDGALPLTVLEKRVENWIASRKVETATKN